MILWIFQRGKSLLSIGGKEQEARRIKTDIFLGSPALAGNRGFGHFFFLFKFSNRNKTLDTPKCARDFKWGFIYLLNRWNDRIFGFGKCARVFRDSLFLLFSQETKPVGYIGGDKGAEAGYMGDGWSIKSWSCRRFLASICYSWSVSHKLFQGTTCVQVFPGPSHLTCVNSNGTTTENLLYTHTYPRYSRINNGNIPIQCIYHVWCIQNNIRLKPYWWNLYVYIQICSEYNQNRRTVIMRCR